jgi:hypothetical protein
MYTAILNGKYLFFKSSINWRSGLRDTPSQPFPADLDAISAGNLCGEGRNLF